MSNKDIPKATDWDVPGDGQVGYLGDVGRGCPWDTLQTNICRLGNMLFYQTLAFIIHGKILKNQIILINLK